ncbi:MAG: cobalt-precorrin 5A hydrolase [Pelosinus sp.]|nr:cobalt-precorrin 5A hydrolase [Pelosinus sp.]
MKLAIISVTVKGAALAAKLAVSLAGETTLYAKAGRGASAKTLTYTKLGELICEIFSQYDGLVFIMAAGIVVRVIAPHVVDKRFDPAVVVLDDGGNHAISLLSGHLGGANELTARVANAIGARPVITTATDVAKKVAPDVVSRKLQLAIEPFAQLKTINALLASGEEVVYYLDASLPNAGELAEKAKELKITLGDMTACFETKAWQSQAGAVFITDKTVEADIPHLCLRPKSLVVGVGCRRGTSKELIVDAIETACQTAGRSTLSIQRLCSVDIKQDEEGLLAAGEDLGVGLEFFPPEKLAACIQKYKLSVSNFVIDKIGVGNVCEAAALLAAHKSHLVLSKTKFQQVTIAIAEVRCW